MTDQERKEIRFNYLRLCALAINLNNKRDTLRATVAKIAGCDIREWSMDTIFEYIKLGRQTYGQTNT